MKKISTKSFLLLLLTAVIWGTAFVAQSAGTDYAGPFTFNAVRSAMGGLVLIPCIYFLDRGKKKRGEQVVSDRKALLKGGVLCGVVLFIASNLQQIGIQYTTAGKAGFITALYIVIVPIMGIFLKKFAGLKVWMGVLLAAVGLYFLCITDSLKIGMGDIYILVCAICFAVHILVIDYYSPLVDGVKMSCIQFLVCAVLSAVPMFLFESPQTESILAGWLPLVYAGVMSCGVAYTLQIVGQRGADPTIVSLILSLEAVVSVLAGFLILGERLSSREFIGCILMFAAIILAQLPEREKKKTASENRDSLSPSDACE